MIAQINGQVKRLGIQLSKVSLKVIESCCLDFDFDFSRLDTMTFRQKLMMSLQLNISNLVKKIVKVLVFLESA